MPYSVDPGLLQDYALPQLNAIPERAEKIIKLADLMDTYKAKVQGQRALEQRLKDARVKANLQALTPTVMGQVAPPAETIEPDLSGMQPRSTLGNIGRMPEPSTYEPAPTPKVYVQNPYNRLHTPSAWPNPSMPVERWSTAPESPLQNMTPTDVELMKNQAETARAEYELEQLQNKGIPDYIKQQDAEQAQRQADLAMMSPDLQRFATMEVPPAQAEAPAQVPSPAIQATPAPVAQVSATNAIVASPTKDEIKAFQASVGLTPDGIVGSLTKQKIKEFQQANGLTPDGIIGRNTITAIRQALQAPVPAPIQTTTEVPAPQAEVAPVQAPAPVSEPKPLIVNFQAQPAQMPTKKEVKDMYQQLEDEYADIQEEYNYLRNKPGLSMFAEERRKARMADLTGQADMLKTFEEAKAKRGTAQKQVSVAIGALLTSSGYDPEKADLKTKMGIRDALVNSGLTDSNGADRIVNDPVLAQGYMNDFDISQQPFKLKKSEIEAEQANAKATLEFNQKHAKFMEGVELRKLQLAEAEARRKQNQDARKESEAEEVKKQQSKIMEETLNREKTKAVALLTELSSNPKATGQLQSTFADMWSSNEASDRRRDLDQIKYGTGFKNIVDLKKQGVTFGNMTEQEFSNSLKAATKLDFGASVKNNMEALQEYIESLDRALINLPDRSSVRSSINTPAGGTGGEQVSQEEAQRLLNQYR